MWEICINLREFLTKFYSTTLSYCESRKIKTKFSKLPRIGSKFCKII